MGANQGSADTTYVVICEGQPCLMDRNGVLRAIDMADCVHVEAVYRVSEDTGKLEELSIRGTWSDVNDPLYICVHDAEGAVVLEGHGTDH